MGFIQSNTLLKTGLESGSGRITPTENLYIEDFSAPAPELDKVEFEPVSDYKGVKDHFFIDDWGRMKFDATLPMATDKTGLDSFLKLCGLSAAAFDDSGVTGTAYTLDSSSAQTGSFDVITPRRTYALSGAVADVTISAKVGERVSAKFAVQSGMHDTTTLASGDANNTMPMVSAPEFVLLGRASGVTENGNSFEAEEVTFALGADIKQIKSTQSNLFCIQNVDPKITIKAKLTEAMEDGFNDLVNGASFTLSVGLNDKDGVKKWELVANAAKPDDVAKLSDQDGIFVFEKSYRLRPVSGDDNFTIKHFD